MRAPGNCTRGDDFLVAMMGYDATQVPASVACREYHPLAVDLGLVRLSRRIWFRAALFAVLSALSALIAAAAAPFIPAGLAYQFEAGALHSILQILASSMLIVATFSLSTVISAYAAASTGTTPRVTELLLRDPTAQNALSTFVGACSPW